MIELTPIAYREAGHAIAAWLLTDYPIDTVTILAGNPSVGALVREHLLDDDELDLALEYGHQEEIRRNRSRIEDAILVSIAGPYAQRRHAPSSKWKRGKDLKEAADLVYRLHQTCPAGVTSAFRRYTNVFMDGFLEMHWNAIEALAHRLVCNPLVSKDEAMAAALALAAADLAGPPAAAPLRIAAAPRLNWDGRRP